MKNFNSNVLTESCNMDDTVKALFGMPIFTCIPDHGFDASHSHNLVCDLMTEAEGRNRQLHTNKQIKFVLHDDLVCELFGANKGNEALFLCGEIYHFTQELFSDHGDRTQLCLVTDWDGDYTLLCEILYHLDQDKMVYYGTICKVRLVKQMEAMYSSVMSTTTSKGELM